jgi:glycerophosphoryl diester phosphodiesterase
VTARGQLLKIAHRGAAGTAPELTRAAFLRALELGVDMIELDIQLTKDGYLVVIHDHDLLRTTGTAGAVRDHPLAEIKQLDSGAWFDPRFRGEKILTLEEVVQLVGRRAMLNVEIKSPPGDWSNTALKTVAILTHAGILGTTVISCFQMPALQKVRELSPAARLGVLWHEPDLDEAWRWAHELAAWAVHPWSKIVAEDVVGEAHRRGLRVLTWTVNDPDEIEQMVGLGVDGIISDFPERLLHARRHGGATEVS